MVALMHSCCSLACSRWRITVCMGGVLVIGAAVCAAHAAGERLCMLQPDHICSASLHLYEPVSVFLSGHKSSEPDSARAQGAMCSMTRSNEKKQRAPHLPQPAWLIRHPAHHLRCQASPCFQTLHRQTRASQSTQRYSPTQLPVQRLGFRQPYTLNLKPEPSA